MIARLWRGRVATADAAAYVRYIESTGIAEYTASPGQPRRVDAGARSRGRQDGGRDAFLLDDHGGDQGIRRTGIPNRPSSTRRTIGISSSARRP